ncbi:MAG TPA: glutamate--tRNA ligase [Flavitalea sp.]|nr:glutamate--tRNA ligase [Flavitalea sp.]
MRLTSFRYFIMMPIKKGKVRVRFAPSPTGGLHLGGVRTVLYNYLFARQHKGSFILRIEDTDQGRYVEGAEQYILDCLEWCGLEPDEGPHKGGPFSPYRQSERKESYRQYAEQLVQSGHAYYAFDTPEDLEKMREELKRPDNPSPQYDHRVRSSMKNSLTLSQDETDKLLQQNTPHVIRIRVPENEIVSFHDLIRGEVQFNTNSVDDKVLLKADGMPTYHLAVVVDDFLMQITHAFRGEEWLPSSPVHILLWKYLGWKDSMPEWAHLPLILKPDGNGKLSKRDGDRLGFPVFAMDWKDARTGETTQGFREKGFLPEAFINLLAMLGWNDGSGKELFTIEELIESFSLDRVHKSGAKFDFEKAKWFNHEWIKKIDTPVLVTALQKKLSEKNLSYETHYLSKVIELVKERCTYVNDLWEHSVFFFISPDPDVTAIVSKWNDEKTTFFNNLMEVFQMVQPWDSVSLEHECKMLATANNIKPGEVLLPLRIMLVGGKFGPGVFDIAAVLGKQETNKRIASTLQVLRNNKVG